MPDFKPFRALRPHKDYAGKVSARSSDFSDQHLLVEAMKANPHTFHHVTKNHLNYSGAFQEPEKFLPFAAKFIELQKEKGVLVKEQEDAFYIYRQTRKDGRTFKGLIGLSNVEDYSLDRIKRHEEIRPSRLGFMVELCKTTKVLGEPTLLTFKQHRPIELGQGEQIYDFTSIDGKRHIIERMTDELKIQEIRDFLMEVECFYLADGHHRSAAIASFHNQFPQLDNAYCLSLLMEEDELDISAFHRLIRPVVSIPTSELLEKLSRDFDISKSESAVFDPVNKGEFGLFDGKDWYRLVLKYHDHMMDVELLEKYVVHSIYNIRDSRTDSQISFYPQRQGVERMEEIVKEGTFDVVYTLAACQFSEIREISDRHETLPPKSTFIEPKLRSGLIIQEF
ncbi:MAG: DUF1015 domain-containing protein [Bacteroidia bacterium]